MDQLWALKFTSMIPVPGNALSFFFTDRTKAEAVLKDHAAALSGKLEDAMAPLIFQDAIGDHCLRSSFFPHCVMVEIGPCDLAMKEINDRIGVSQRAAGFIKDVGFKTQEGNHG